MRIGRQGISRRWGALVLALAAIASLAGCAGTPQASTSLYDELGGETGIHRIVDGLLRNLAADERVRDHFRGIHIAGFRERLEVHFCDVSGGPCRWRGRSMREAHEHLDIRPAAFNALVEALIDAMDAMGLDEGTQNAFLARLAPMQRDIVSGRLRPDREERTG